MDSILVDFCAQSKGFLIFMQTIYRSTHTVNYSVLPNTIPNNTALTAHARLALIYLLGKPKDWKLRIPDLKRALGIGRDKCYQCLSELRAAGYVVMRKVQKGAIWIIYDTPQPIENINETSATYSIIHNPDIQDTEIKHAYKISNNSVNKEITTTTPAIEPPAGNVVVSVSEDLVYPDKLTSAQHKQCKHIIKKCEPTLQQAVLTALTFAMIANKVKCPPAYLQGLVTRANNGLFSPVEAQQATSKAKWQGHKQAPKIDYSAFADDLVKRYGDKAAKIVKKFGIQA